MPVTEIAPRFLRFPFGETGHFLLLRAGLDLARAADFAQFCGDNAEWRIERNALGDISIEMPTKGLVGAQNALLNYQLVAWNLRDAEGLVFDSSAGFTLPSGAMRSPDGAWVHVRRIQALSEKEKTEFLPVVPNFVVEIRSLTDERGPREAKMREWCLAGVRLGVLIDPKERTLSVFRPSLPEQTLTGPEAQQLDCSPELPGFTLDAGAIFAVHSASL